MTTSLPTRRSTLHNGRRRRASRLRRHTRPPIRSARSQLTVRRRSLVFGKRGAAALLFAWLFAISQSVPSYADSPEFHQTLPTIESSGQAQQVIVADGAPTEVTRDSFTVTAPPPPNTRTALTRMAFLNNPASDVQWPFTTSPISSGYGKRIAPCSYGCSSNHQGTGFTPGAGTPVAAIADGIVRQVNSDRGGFGTHVIIEHEIDGKTITSLYAHMAAGSVPVAEGQTITVGTTVGKVGNTGISTGAHLHLQISDRSTNYNPYEWLQTRVR
jgi:murein DD-endopeptidase MepM/ murein hydrolase activator NlpD